MGDVADMMLEGTLCEGCGVLLDGGPSGFPRYCPDCARLSRRRDADAAAAARKVRCPTCGKRVKKVGLQQHRRDAHGMGEDS